MTAESVVCARSCEMCALCAPLDAAVAQGTRPMHGEARLRRVSLRDRVGDRGVQTLSR